MLDRLTLITIYVYTTNAVLSTYSSVICDTDIGSNRGTNASLNTQFLCNELGANHREV